MEQGKCPKCGEELAYDCITDDGLHKEGEDWIVNYHVECLKDCGYTGVEKYRLVFMGNKND